MKRAETSNQKSAVKERPILMSGPMVWAILEGRKMQTRRVVGAKWLPLVEKVLAANQGKWVWETLDYTLTTPYGRPGDRLWVRETWAPNGVGNLMAQMLKAKPQPALYYRADHSGAVSWRWRPSIFMPRWASRITLEIVSVRVERLHQITHADCLAEGIRRCVPIVGEKYEAFFDYAHPTEDPCEWFSSPDAPCVFPHAVGFSEEALNARRRP